MSNLDVIKRKLTDYAIKAENRIMTILFDVADDLVYWIEDNGGRISGAMDTYSNGRWTDNKLSYSEGYGQIPVKTGNLRDSTGVGVYYNGSLRKFSPSQIATVSRDGLWGSQQLSKALNLASSSYNTGLWIVIFSTMPYAMKIDNRVGYFSEGLRDDLLNSLKVKIKNGTV